MPGDRVAEGAGGSSEALALKKDVDRRGLLETTRRGNKVSYVVKRILPDGSRPFFVVIRRHPKKSPGRGQPPAAAAPVQFATGADAPGERRPARCAASPWPGVDRA